MYQAAISTRPPQPCVPAEQSLADIYDRWFEIVSCDTPELIRAAQRLRYQVYCLETGFEDPAQNPGGLETDEADAHSRHHLLLHRPTGMIAGTVRLILPSNGGKRFNVPALDISPVLRGLDGQALPKSGTAEISRFAISKDFRNRIDDGLYTSSKTSMPISEGYTGGLDVRAMPSITLGLMRAIVTMTREAGMSHVVAVVEPALARLLLRLGIRFERTGEQVSYHGIRYPVFRDMTALLAEIHERRPDVWEVITDRGSIWPLEGIRAQVFA